jgi:hypothetical protein
MRPVLTLSSIDEIVRAIESLSPVDKARLLDRVAARQAQSHQLPMPPSESDDVLKQLPTDTPAGKLARDPNSSLARVLAMLPTGFIPPTDADVERLREERLLERYGL